jgi:sugar phosphate isomerase/epimerase
MQLGIFAKTFQRPTLDETLDAVVAHGLTHIQFNMSCLGVATLPDRLEESSCIWIARSLSERGLKMAAISGTFNMCDPDATNVQNNLRRLDLLAAACRWLDTRIITLCTGTRNPVEMWHGHPENVRKQTWESLVETVKQACKIADRNEVTLAFEPEVHNVVNSVTKARRLLDEVGSPWLKVVIDPANLPIPHSDIFLLTDHMYNKKNFDSKWVESAVSVSEPLLKSDMDELFDEAFDWLGPEIVLAHAKEPRLNEVWPNLMKLLDKDAVQRLQQRVFYSPYFDRLKKIGFDGAIVIHGLKESDVESRVSILKQSLKSTQAEG